MSYSNVTVNLIGGANVSSILTTSDLSSAQTYIQMVAKNAGIWLPLVNATSSYQVFYPTSSILSITVG
jgi:hypothetical protein